MVTERMSRSLEMKWRSIKHDVSKFHGVYLKFKDFNERGKSDEAIICDALELYALEHSKGVDLEFHSCWHIVRELLSWVELLNGATKYS